MLTTPRPRAGQAGGDFHSRTAMGMFSYIAEACDKGEVLLEWDKSQGKAPRPLIKVRGGEWRGDPLSRPLPAHADSHMEQDVYAAERRKAKVLNFSIAYGKTPVGLAKDFGVTEKEAKETLELWYKVRRRACAVSVHALTLGRSGPARGARMARASHFRCPEAPVRAAGLALPARRGACSLFMQIHANTDGAVPRPALHHRPPHAWAWAAGRNQHARARCLVPLVAGCATARLTCAAGGAADVVMMAMLKIHYNQRLRDMGWKLLLQIHDEVILEGPKESQSEAKALVVSLMECPFAKPLRVDLVVDAKCASTWYEAK